MQQNKVLAFGYYGDGNLGDELLLATLKIWAQDFGAEVVFMSVNPLHTNKFHYIKSIDAFDLPAVAKEMMECCLFVLGGGGLFQNYDKLTISGLYDFRANDISMYARPFLLANQMGVPTLLWAQGIGPLNCDESRRIVHEIFNAATYVSLRDTDSLSLLRGLGVSRTALVAPDPVWAYPLPSTLSTRADSEKRIGIVLRPWEFAEGWEDRFIMAIKNAIPPADHKLVWIPFHLIDELDDSNYKLNFFRRMMSRLAPDFSQELIEESEPKEIIQTLAECDAIIAMRLHAQILALRLGKPTLSIQYDHKMETASIQAESPHNLRLRPNEPQCAWDQAIRHLLERDPVKSVPKSKINQLEQETLLHKQILETAITQSCSPSSLKQKKALSVINHDWLNRWTTDHYQGKISDLNAQASESNRIIAERDATISGLSSELATITSSTSWRITRPLRFANLIFHAPVAILYNLLRISYWRMPPLFRQYLQGPRYSFVRWTRKLRPGGSINSKLAGDTISELSWLDFTNQVLSQREHYKGIFVQELNVDWNMSLYQRPQHISAALGHLGYLVIYRTSDWSADRVNGFREVSKNVWLTNRPEIATLTRIVRSFYSTAYFNTPGLLMKNGKRGVLVYEYIDHIDPQISGDKNNIRRLLKLKKFAFEGGADYIIASAQKLYDEALEAVGQNKALLVQNGVDTSHYRNPAHNNTTLSENFTSFIGKFSNIIGYFGALAPWLWYEVIGELVSMRPDLGFVFIGPDYNGGSYRLPKANNLLYLGAIDYKILPAYALKFDVCFIPFEPGEIARTTSPLKLFEYFALEKPVVVTHEMLECIAFKEVKYGDSAETLSLAIDQASICKNDPAFKARLAKLADDNDWVHRARAMEVVFDGLNHKD